METQKNRSIRSPENGYHYALIVNKLSLSQVFLNEQADTITKSFGGALLFIWERLTASDFSNGHIFAINQCLHLSSTVAQLCSNSSRLQETMAWLKPFARKHLTDSSSVISAAVLAHLFDMVEGKRWLPHEDLLAKLKRARPKHIPADAWYTKDLRQRLAGANWMIGSTAAHELGLQG